MQKPEFDLGIGQWELQIGVSPMEIQWHPAGPTPGNLQLISNGVSWGFSIYVIREK
tara:strand:+ start:178 stop:345 length:168 start_codon:yes stop_codon:yes gene_type:complete